MNKRRALLASSKKTAPIYKKGAADWQNVEKVIQYQYALATIEFASDYLRVGSENAETTGAMVGLRINEANYNNYKTLVFTAKEEGTSTQYIKIGWSRSSDDIDNAITSYRLSKSKERYKIDISNNTGTRYILLNLYSRNQNIYIYDMHFE